MALLCLAAAAVQPCPAAAGDGAGIKALIGARDAVLVADAEGRILLAKNADTLLVPASTLKVLTALTALHYLGADHRFVTPLYLDASGNLKVKGTGDPLLTSESFLEIAQSLARNRPPLTTFGDLIMDPSYFSPSLTVPGKGNSSQPYDAPIGALSANFNTVAFQKNASGQYVSTEVQTPLLPSVLPAVRASGLKRGRITLSHHHDENTRYAGELLLFFLKKEGIRANGRVRIGTAVPDTDREIYRYVSPFRLDQVVAQLLEFSNNFIANQLLVSAGAAAYAPPGTLAKGVRAARDFSRRTLGLHIRMVEGSGLSRQNRLSARQLNTILGAFEPYRHLMRYEKGEYYKTGSLRGIRTRAGYVADSRGRWCRFVVLCNTPGKQTKRIMERIKAFVNTLG
jgi:D-alanyl-D-alanine carboxypeptidase/D-alanyl-D-alanine-endopeptidase (penicillin-binding protein 4)